MIYDPRHLSNLLVQAGIPLEAFTSVDQNGNIEWATPEAEAQYTALAEQVKANYTPPIDYDAEMRALVAWWLKNNLIAQSTRAQFKAWMQNNISDPLAEAKTAAQALPASATKSILLALINVMQKQDRVDREVVESVQVIGKYMRLDVRSNSVE